MHTITHQGVPYGNCGRHNARGNTIYHTVRHPQSLHGLELHVGAHSVQCAQLARGVVVWQGSIGTSQKLCIFVRLSVGDVVWLLLMWCWMMSHVPPFVLWVCHQHQPHNRCAGIALARPPACPSPIIVSTCMCTTHAHNGGHMPGTDFRVGSVCVCLHWHRANL